jgi:predicted DNA-binding transcriptional regulator AlpA
MITLTSDQLDRLLTDTRDDLVRRILSEKGDQLTLLTGAQVCEILKVSRKTLDNLPASIPRVTIVPGTLIRYRLTDVEAYIESRIAR